jgi:hypothetical protein
LGGSDRRRDLSFGISKPQRVRSLSKSVLLASDWWYLTVYVIDQLFALNRRGRKRSSNPVVRDVVRIPIKLKTLNERYRLLTSVEPSGEDGYLGYEGSYGLCYGIRRQEQHLARDFRRPIDRRNPVGLLRGSG